VERERFPLFLVASLDGAAFADDFDLTLFLVEDEDDELLIFVSPRSSEIILFFCPWQTQIHKIQK
jgi:hypothetical protein